MNTRKKVIAGFSVLVAAGILLFLIQWGYLGITGLVIFSQGTQTSFVNGTYLGTVHNGTSIALSGTNLTGNYTSQVIDAGQPSNWNNISLVKNAPTKEYLYAIDPQSDVWRSENSGVNWSLLLDDYTGASGNGITDSVFNFTGGYHLVFNQATWMSNDGGLSWTQTDSDYNNGEGNNADVLASDNNGNLYIVEGDDDVWKSTDSGITWTKVATNFNNGNGNVGGFRVNRSNVIFAADNAEDFWQSTNGGVNWTLVADNYNGATATDPDDMVIDSSNNFYILEAQRLWKSTNSGVNWTEINSDFNGAGDSQSGISMAVDSSNNLYIADAGEDVFSSNDGGTSFSQVATNFNGGNGNVPTIEAIAKTTNLTYQFTNCSSADCSDGVFRGPGGPGTFYTSSFSTVGLTGRYFRYRVFFESGDTGLSAYLNNVSIDYSFSASTPGVNIASPADGQTFGTNESLALNYIVTNSTSALDSCWYSINGAANISLPSCQNTTFSVPGDGSYSLNLYANETVLGLVGVDNVNFSVQLGAPSISLSAPIDVYLNYTQNIEFVYTATDLDISTCSLWGDFTGTFIVNQTDSSITSGAQSSFFLNLTQGTYHWNVFCNDTLGNGAFNGNKTFYIDTTKPTVALRAPNGTYSAFTIPLNFSVLDTSPVVCNYNVSFLATGTTVIANTPIACELNTTTFSVDTESNYLLYFRANDSAGNMQVRNATFSVDMPEGTPGPAPSAGGGGGGGGGGGLAGLAKLSLTSLSELDMRRGESDIILLGVTNTGNRFLNHCKLSASGSMQSWISNQQVESLSSGQKKDFIFDISVPIDAGSESYTSDVTIKCDEVSASTSLVVNIAQGDFGFLILSSERVGNNLLISYSLEDFSGRDQTILIEYSLRNPEGIIVLSAAEEILLRANEREENTLEIELPKDSVGEYTLVFDVSNQLESSKAEQTVLLSPVSGLAIFDISDANKKALGWFIALVAIGASCYFVFRFFKTHGRKVKVHESKNRHFIKINLDEKKGEEYL